ncbi:MAG: xanthine dehydrogenase small subunit [Pseudomonadales bacterium]
MQVVVNGAVRTLVGEPEYTLLDALRLDLGLTGTKEGCRSGDCGACTVLIRESGQLPFYPVNSCILPVGQLEGQEVLTVEGLAQDGELHPIQGAMVDHHGSQCGFCTPGFVMALAGWLEHQKIKDVEDQPATQAIQEAIAGNLCRCTGYRPILEAARAALLKPLPVLGVGATAGQDALSDPTNRSLAELGLERNQRGQMNPGEQAPQAADLEQSSEIATASQTLGDSAQDRVAAFRVGLDPNGGGARAFYAPEDLASLHLILSALPDAVLIAGGTDLMLAMTQSGGALGDVVSLSKVQAIQSIELNEDSGVIGAGATYSDLMDSARIAWPELHRFLSRLGSPQIRNRGTVGGNLGTASPIGDMLPILLAMDAMVVISSAKGVTRQLSIGDFIRGYRKTALNQSDYIREVRIQGLQDFHRYYKVSKRQEDDISSVSVAVRVQTQGQCIRDVSVAVGGVADRALRLADIESAFIGKSLTEASTLDISALVGEVISPISDVRASAAYRTAVTARLIQRAMIEASGDSMATIYEAASDA